MFNKQWYRGIDLVAVRQVDGTWLVSAGNSQLPFRYPTADAALSEARGYVDRERSRRVFGVDRIASPEAAGARFR